MALARGVHRLLELQHPSGSWSDFYVAAGASDAWVTAYAGYALALAAGSPSIKADLGSTARRGAERAADWLMTHRSPGGGWGYNGSVAADADSSAWAIRMLAALGREVPSDALVFLAAHATEEGYRTYANREQFGRWADPSPDVTAAALLAQVETGIVDPAGLAGGWQAMLAPVPASPGAWDSCWWDDDGYATVLALEVWAAAGRPCGCPSIELDQPTTAFGCALRLHAAALTGKPLGDLRDRLLDLEAPGGGWAGDARLMVPRSSSPGTSETAVDARGIFTTATAIRALLAAGGAAAAPAVLGERPARSARRSQLGERYDNLLADIAGDIGVDASDTLTVFRALTHESLADPAPWPARQLSSLADGWPVELSASAGPPALRYTTEVGEPALPPYERASSGLAAVKRASEILGYGDAWTSVVPALEEFVAPYLPAPDPCRFWVWAGVDAVGSNPPLLKIYLAVQDNEVPGGRGRLVRALGRLGVASTAPALTITDRLDRAGVCHELGLGLRADGRVGAKVYYDLRGWRPPLVAEMLAAAGLPPTPEEIRPHIPGILQETLAAKQRAGIALRIRLPGGEVDEVTMAAAFPPALVGHAEFAVRVRAWLDCTGGDLTSYDALVGRLLPKWKDGRSPPGKLHSLFTRTRTQRGVSNTVYLRPLL